MTSANIISLLIGICIFYICFGIFSKPLKIAAIFLFNGLVGIFGIFIVDFLLSPYNIAVGINFFTVLFGAVLGLPGIVSLYGITWFFTL